MKNPGACRVLVCADASAGHDVRPLLREAGYQISDGTLAEADPAKLEGLDLVIVDGLGRDEEARRVCQRFRNLQGDRYIPMVLLTAHLTAELRRGGLEAGADTVLGRPFEGAELLAQIQALLRIKERHDLLFDKAAEVNRINKRLQSAYQQIDQELELARRIQESFLPQTLPKVSGVRFAVKYQPCGRVGGDFYDIYRLDEHHLGFYVADAMGHGVPASLLTIFVKKGVRAKEINGQHYRLVPPDEVLSRLNHDLIDQSLSENPFITMVYVLFNHRDGTFRFSRSGHPYPLYLPREGPPVLWQIEGSLLGVFETKYPVKTQQVSPGDRVLLYTDGIDGASFDGQPVGVASLLAAADKYRQLPIQEMVDRLSVDLFARTKQADDLTLLGMEIVGPEPVT